MAMILAFPFRYLTSTLRFGTDFSGLNAVGMTCDDEACACGFAAPLVEGTGSGSVAGTVNPTARWQHEFRTRGVKSGSEDEDEHSFFLVLPAHAFQHGQLNQGHFLLPTDLLSG